MQDSTSPTPAEEAVKENERIYQLAINRGFRTNWDKIDEETRLKYAEFRREMDRVKGTIHAIPNSRSMTGDYDHEFYEFFNVVGSKEDAENLKKSILERRLSKEVFIDELFSGSTKNP